MALMTLAEIIKQKEENGIDVRIVHYEKSVPITVWRKVRFGKQQMQHVVGQMIYNWYCIIENGVETLRVGAALQNSAVFENRLYEQRHLVAQNVPCDAVVQSVFSDIKSLYEASEIAKKNKKAQETARLVKMQKTRVYSYVLEKDEFCSTNITLGEVIATKKQGGNKINIECNVDCADDGSGAMLLRVMENGAPILGVRGYWSDAVAYDYMDGIEWLNDARVFWYVKGEPCEPDDIFVETRMSIFEDVLALYNLQEKKKKEEEDRRKAEQVRHEAEEFYAQWGNKYVAEQIVRGVR